MTKLSWTLDLQKPNFEIDTYPVFALHLKHLPLVIT